MLEFRILGALEASDQGRALPLGTPKQRALLAVLLLHRREIVSTDRLIDELWNGRPPDTATKTVQVYVSRLRKVLGEQVLVTRGGGYVLEVGDDQVDADRFERLAVEGRDALEGGDARSAAETLRSALELWRGEPLADFTFEEFARNEIGRLEELRLVALEDRINAEIALGRHSALVPELERLVADHPERERLRGQLMLALYRSGRQAEALETYREARGCARPRSRTGTGTGAAGARARHPDAGSRDRRAGTVSRFRAGAGRAWRAADLGGRCRTARRRRWWSGRCRPRRGWRAPTPTLAPRRPCGGPCHEARGTYVWERPWPPGRASAAVLGLCPAWWS